MTQLPPLFPLQIIFLVFGPEIACQAPKRHISFPSNKMRLACFPSSIRYTGYRSKKNTRDAQRTAGHFASPATFLPVNPLLAQI
jgi:hypothetical protein